MTIKILTLLAGLALLSPFFLLFFRMYSIPDASSQRIDPESGVYQAEVTHAILHPKLKLFWSAQPSPVMGATGMTFVTALALLWIFVLFWPRIATISEYPDENHSHDSPGMEGNGTSIIDWHEFDLEEIRKKIQEDRHSHQSQPPDERDGAL